MKKFATTVLSAALVITLLNGCDSNYQKPVQTPKTTASAALQTEAANLTEPPAAALTQSVETTEEPSTKPAPETKEETKAVPKETQANTSAPYALPEPQISKDEAQKAALDHAGLSASGISRYKAELDRERGTLVYEIEFDSGKYEYEYEIDAESGKVLKSEKELRD